MTSCGRSATLEDSRELNVTPSLIVLASRKLCAPSDVTASVTSHSTQSPVAIAPASASGPVDGAGRLLHVIALSPQSLGAPDTAGPLTVELVACRRSLALVTLPDSPP